MEYEEVKPNEFYWYDQFGDNEKHLVFIVSNDLNGILLQHSTGPFDAAMRGSKFSKFSLERELDALTVEERAWVEGNKKTQGRKA